MAKARQNLKWDTWTVHATVSLQFTCYSFTSQSNPWAFALTLPLALLIPWKRKTKKKRTIFWHLKSLSVQNPKNIFHSPFQFNKKILRDEREKSLNCPFALAVASNGICFKSFSIISFFSALSFYIIICIYIYIYNFGRSKPTSRPFVPVYEGRKSL